MSTTVTRVVFRAFSAILLAAFVVTASADGQAVPLPDPEQPPVVPTGVATIALPPVASPPVESPPVPVPSPEEPANGATTAAIPSSLPAPGSGRFGLLLHDGTYLIGVFGETKVVPFEAVFGNIEIPIASIQVVDFSVVVNGTKTHRVQFVNGDMLTGNVGKFEPMKFETSYGTVFVPMESMVRMSYGAPAARLAYRPADRAVDGKTAAVNVPPPGEDPPGPIRPLRSVPVPAGDVR